MDAPASDAEAGRENTHSQHRFVTAQGGYVHSTEGYYAYGRTRSGGISLTDHRFTGQKRDGTGLQYFNARYGW